MTTTNDTKIKTGLVLEGGALRGLYTMGIVDVLIENNLHFDGLIGVSAGAAFGCNYLSRQPAVFCVITSAFLMIGAIAVYALGCAQATFSGPNLPIITCHNSWTDSTLRRSRPAQPTFIWSARMLKQVVLSIKRPNKRCLSTSYANGFGPQPPCLWCHESLRLVGESCSMAVCLIRFLCAISKKLASNATWLFSHNHAIT